jgi:hypothetical protein
MNWRILALIALFGLGACNGGSRDVAANNVSEDPFGATGAPGADMTDNGATDGASGNIGTNQG